MSRVALDLPPELLLAGAALLPLASIAWAYLLELVHRVVPPDRNPFTYPNGGNGPVPYVHSGRRTWKHWLLAVVAGAQAAVWAVYSVKNGVQGGTKEWEWAVGMGLVAAGWVSDGRLCKAAARGERPARRM